MANVASQLSPNGPSAGSSTELMISDLAERFEQNPLIRPQDVPPSADGLVVEGVFNPGAFRQGDRIFLLLRVAERPVPREGIVTTPIFDATTGEIRVLQFHTDDPLLRSVDARGFWYGNQIYLTTLSHLRLASSRDGISFEVEPKPLLTGLGPLETFGMEDCRVTEIEGCYYLTYTQVSPNGAGVGLISTKDWQQFERHGMIFAPPNKDCAVFPEPINGVYFALHRPSTAPLGGNFIWLASSPDLEHWGDHQVLLRTRPNSWDSSRVGAGAAPIRIDEGWLEIYHGADENDRYALGAVLLDAYDPHRILARSATPIMEPIAPYERNGFFNNVVFSNGLVRSGDELLLYYGAADRLTCGARLSIKQILDSLEEE